MLIKNKSDSLCHIKNVLLRGDLSKTEKGEKIIEIGIDIYSIVIYCNYTSFLAINKTNEWTKGPLSGLLVQ